MNIYVSNLSQNIVEDDLRLLFAAYGEVSFVQIIKDRQHAVSRGTALIKMPSSEQGKQAVACLHQTEIDGQPIVVAEAVSYLP